MLSLQCVTITISVQLFIIILMSLVWLLRSCSFISKVPVPWQPTNKSGKSCAQIPQAHQASILCTQLPMWRLETTFKIEDSQTVSLSFYFSLDSLRSPQLMCISMGCVENFSQLLCDLLILRTSMLNTCLVYHSLQMGLQTQVKQASVFLFLLPSKFVSVN